MLKELNMNITEIETYRKAPSPASFLAIDDAKEKEIDRQIQKLKMLKVSERFYGLCRHFCCKCVVNRMFLFDKMIQYSPLRELISEGIFIRWF